MLLMVFTLQLYLMYPISTDNMSVAICAPWHSQLFLHCSPSPPCLLLCLLSLPHVQKKKSSKAPPSWRQSAIALHPLSSLFSLHHLLLKNPEVIKCLEDGHISSGGRPAAKSSRHHGMLVLLRPITHSLAIIIPTNLLHLISKAPCGRMKSYGHCHPRPCQVGSFLPFHLLTIS